MADLTLEVAQSHAEAPHQTGYSAKERKKTMALKILTKPVKLPDDAEQFVWKEVPDSVMKRDTERFIQGEEQEYARILKGEKGKKPTT